jgi:hypothetical protein
LGTEALGHPTHHLRDVTKLCSFDEDALGTQAFEFSGRFRTSRRVRRWSCHTEKAIGPEFVVRGMGSQLVREAPAMRVVARPAPPGLDRANVAGCVESRLGSPQPLANSAGVARTARLARIASHSRVSPTTPLAPAYAHQRSHAAGWFASAEATSRDAPRGRHTPLSFASPHRPSSGVVRNVDP